MNTPQPLRLKANRDDHRIAALAALAIAIHIVEAALPSPIPGVKPGLANVITLVVLFRYGWSDAAWISLLRVFAGSLLIGSFMTPAFAMSLAGACASLLILGLTWRINRHLPKVGLQQGLGPVGFSILASVAHMTGQLIIARLLIIPHNGLFYLLPLLITAAVLFGIVSGIISQLILRQLDST